MAAILDSEGRGGAVGLRSGDFGLQPDIGVHLRFDLPLRAFATFGVSLRRKGGGIPG